MKGIHLRFYTYENRKHGTTLMYEWLLEFAKARGIHGGSAFRAIAGFGRQGRMHEQHFFELAGDTPVLVEFIADASQADALLAALRAEEVGLFCARLEADFEELGPPPT
ncbi:MAG: DUF190 domain-containing protein [Proteobacteria bacterium]|nr:DUF190 domain-containing protein [Pseudomonadota bacterium]